jgi:hypothetical protein
VTDSTAPRSVAVDERPRAVTDGRPGDRQAASRIDNLTKDVGWLFVAVGVFGVIAPGIPGVPFLVVGALVVTPGGTKLLSRWAANNPPKIVKGAMRQMNRFLDDLDRRYPPQPERSE